MAAAEAGQQKRAEENDELTIKDGDTDICQQLMDRYAKSSAAQHGHLVATAAAMRSILVAESLPSTPPAYFAAAISSADSTVNSPATDPVAVSALLTFLSIVVPLVPSGEISTEKAREAVTVLVSLIDRDEEKLGVASLRGGVKCIGTLLIGFCNLDDWESLDLGFASLLKFAVDKRPKVRRCAQECLEKILGSLQSSTVIKEASNTVYASFKEYKPVLAELSSSRIDEGSKVDLSLKTQNAEAVYVLNVLGVAIPFISSKLRSRAFSELCNLMASQFSLLTRQILKAMEVFFANSRDEISVPEIESIITSLTGYLSSHDKNPSDTVVQATILLRSALEKLHLVDSKLCLKKLPLVFGDLAGLLTSNDDTASQALDVLKDLINRHVDKDIVEGCLPFEGEENVADGNKIGATKSVCAVFESILDSCDAIPNERILDVTAILIDKLGELSYVLMRNIVLKLASLMTSATGDACSLKHLQHCIGSAVVAMGPEKILELLPISICADNRSCTNSWLIPILKRYIVGASLGYYIEHIVPLSKSILQTSRKAHRKKLQACSHELMELLPAFCNYPVDVAQNFGSLAKLLVKFINKYPFMNEAITLSLQRLVNQNKSKLRPKINPGEAKTCPGEDNTSELESENRYSKKTSTKNIKALASCSAELLQSLVDMFTGLGTEVSSDFKTATGCLASIVDSSVRKQILTSLLEKLDTIDDESENERQVNVSDESFDEEKDNPSGTKTHLKRSSVLAVAITFVEGANEDLIELIYNLVRQTFEATDEVDHCEAYHTLSRVLEEHEWFCSSHFAELMEMLLSRKSPDDAGSLRSRFTCFHVLMVHALQLTAEEENEKAFPILNEIILALKDGKEESRKTACDVLVMVYTSLKSKSCLSGDELCPKLINMIMGYISASSPHIKSGAVSALSILVYKDPEICLSSPDLLSSVLSLIHTKAVEVIKAVLGFVKVVVSTLNSKDLQNLLHDLVWEILPWSSVSRHHFRSKVTVIVEIMIRKCGARAVLSVAPEKHKGFVKTVSENRSGKSNAKEEADDNAQTKADDSSRMPQKRKRDESSEDAAVAEQKKSKWQKKRPLAHSSVSADNGTGKRPKHGSKRNFRNYKEASGNNPAQKSKPGLRKERQKPQKKRFIKAH